MLEEQEKRHQQLLKQAVQFMKIIDDWKTKTVIDYTKPWQKYVLLTDKNWNIVFASKHLERHRDIVSHIWAEKNSVIWWWRIAIDDQEKIFKIYGHSWDFWKVPSEFNQIFISIIGKQYPDYKIIVE